MTALRGGGLRVQARNGGDKLGQAGAFASTHSSDDEVQFIRTCSFVFVVVRTAALVRRGRFTLVPRLGCWRIGVGSGHDDAKGAATRCDDDAVLPSSIPSTFLDLRFFLSHSHTLQLCCTAMFCTVLRS